MDGWKDGWMEGRMGGSQSQVKDCLQQSTKEKLQNVNKYQPSIKEYWV